MGAWTIGYCSSWTIIGWRKAHGLSSKKSATFNLLHTDPETTEPADYRLGLCCATDRVDANEAGVVAGRQITCTTGQEW